MNFRREVLPNNNEEYFSKVYLPIKEGCLKEKEPDSLELNNAYVVRKNYCKDADDQKHNFDNNVVTNTVQITTEHFEDIDSTNKSTISGDDKVNKPNDINKKIKASNSMIIDFGLSKRHLKLN